MFVLVYQGPNDDACGAISSAELFADASDLDTRAA